LFARLLDSDIENIGEQRSGGYRRLFFPHSIPLDDLTSSQKEEEEKIKKYKVIKKYRPNHCENDNP
jgi:hypothetical protein